MKNMIIIGAKGQLGRALTAQYPDAQAVDIEELDISDQSAVEAFNWDGIDTILNAAAYTNVDGADTDDGRRLAWRINADAVANLVAVAAQKDMTFVHISTDYVFDGAKEPHTELESFSPLNVYGASKAAGDLVVSMLPKFYLLRTSWVIGDGKNFVRTMLDVGQKGINPTVVSDQTGRLTFTSELVRAIDHLLRAKAKFGTYNVSNDGDVAAWSDIARAIFTLAGLKNSVTDISTAQYFSNKPEAAKRPLASALDLSRLHDSGFVSRDWRADLAEYVKKELS